MYEPIEKVIPLLEKQGYQVKDPWDIVDIFEKKVAEYAGSRYAVSVDNCTDGLFLCLKYLNATGPITIPAKTYISVPCAIAQAACDTVFEDKEWQGVYQLTPYPVYDGATRFRKGMYVEGSYQCISFHLKKILAIGKGGMILTDDKEAYEWFKIARYEGRHTHLKYEEDNIEMLGWNMYMPPEQAARGILLFEELGDYNPDCGGSDRYHDLRRHSCFKEPSNG